jgi:preprotein translocase subunit SecA
MNEINARIERGEINAQALMAPPQDFNEPAVERNPNDPSTWGKVGRNEACPCGSGKKYKHCHGVLA